MTDTPLCHCSRPSPDAFLCRVCTRVLEKLLAELPSQLLDLQTTITRQARAGSSSGGGHTKASDQPLPIDLRAAHLADLVRGVLVMDIRHLCESRGLPVPDLSKRGRPVPTVDLARWLHGSLDAIRLDEGAGDILGELQKLQRALSGAVDNHGRRFAGPCTALVTVVVTVTAGSVKAELVDRPRQCDQPLYARPGDSTIRCNGRDEETGELLGCGKTYAARDRIRWVIEQAKDDMQPAALIAEALRDAGYHVNLNMINGMVRRQKLFAWREDDEGKPLYRVGDVVDILREKAGDERISA